MQPLLLKLHLKNHNILFAMAISDRILSHPIPLTDYTSEEKKIYIEKSIFNLQSSMN